VKITCASLVLRSANLHGTREFGRLPPIRVQLPLKGQTRPNWAVRAMSALPPIATELRTSLEVRFVRILLQKSAGTD
jgi:hypothetical protein